jgi:integral membrane sensor domain MASE1
VAGASVALVVAVIEMVRLVVQGAIAGAILVAVAGMVLIVSGALSEKRLRGALRRMS